MATEESPLLGHQSDAMPNQSALPTDDIYDRFNHKQKRVILALVSLTGLVPSMSCISL